MLSLGSKLVASVAIAAVLAAAGPAAVAVAGNPLAARGDALFGAMDRNADDAVDGREAFAAGAWVFKRLDENWDGVLSPRETSTAARRVAARAHGDEQRQIDRLMRFAVRYMDSNGDNWVTRDEFDNLGGYLFREADDDGDGRLNRAEFVPMMQRIVGYAAAPRLTTLDR